MTTETKTNPYGTLGSAENLNKLLTGVGAKPISDKITPQDDSTTTNNNTGGRVTRYTTPTTSNTPYGGFVSGLQTDFTDSDAEKIRQDRYQGAQSFIDAIQQRYQTDIGKIQEKGQSTLNRNRSVQSRTGLIGSGTGEGQTGEINKSIKEEEDVRRQEADMEVQALFSEIDNRAMADIKAKQEEIAGNRTAYVDFLKSQSEDVKKNVESLSGLGVSIDELDPADIEDFKKYTGMSDLQLRAYWNSRATQANKVDYKYDITDSGQILAYGADPKTGKVTAQVVNAEGLNPVGSKPIEINGKLVQEQPDGTFKVVYGGETGMTNIDPNSPTYYEDVMRSSSGGKNLTGEERKSLAKAFLVVDQLDSLSSQINKEVTGPILGTIRSFNPYDTKAQTIKAQLTSIVPNLARGVFGEVGVLTDNDVRLYAQTLPNLKSTEDIRNAVLALTLRTVLRSIETQLETQSSAGADVSGFVTQYNKVKNQIENIDSRIGIGEPKTVDQVYQNKPEYRSQIEQMINDGLSDEDIMQTLGFNEVASDTNQARKIANAIMTVESGGKQVTGKSGEYGAFQFLPSTWKKVSQETMGKVIPQTKENEYQVAVKKIQDLLGKGYSAKEIALIWNTSLGGSEKPLVKRGVNKYGQAYDSGSYANNVVSLIS